MHTNFCLKNYHFFFSNTREGKIEKGLVVVFQAWIWNFAVVRISFKGTLNTRDDFIVDGFVSSHPHSLIAQASLIEVI
jgi:hypothetical protein